MILTLRELRKLIDRCNGDDRAPVRVTMVDGKNQRGTLLVQAKLSKDLVGRQTIEIIADDGDYD